MSGTLKKVYAPAPVTTRAKPVLLGNDPKNKDHILYCCGGAVVIRSLSDPSVAELYQEHQSDVTCARYAPSGFYICSADKLGRCRIWDTVNKTHVLKGEYQPISGAVLDMCWSPDSKRIVVVGAGRSKYGHAFFADGGASVGNISNHTKCITTCDMKQTRPYRVVTGSEDNKNNWYPGPPFKWNTSIVKHTRFINCVRFAPDGSLFISVASDKKAYLYDGKTAEEKGALKDEHKGGILCVSWSEDSKQVLTCSADKTAKLWTVADGAASETTFTFPNHVDHQQLGCLWQGEHLITVSLNGNINFLDRNNPDKPLRVQMGHNKLITALAYGNNKLYTGDFTGKSIEWVPETAETEGFTGQPHKSEIRGMAVVEGNLYTIGKDDLLKITPLSTKEWGAGIKIGDQPTALSVGKSGLVAISTLSGVVLFKDGKQSCAQKLDSPATSVALSPDESEVAVGSRDKKIYIYSITGGSLSLKTTLEKHRGEVSALEYSPDGAYLGAGDSNREVILWKGTDPAVTGLVYHTARVKAIAWTPDSKHVATTGLDSNIIVWCPASSKKRVMIKGAHKLGGNGVVWTDNNTLVSVGEDCAMKSWDIEHAA